MGLFASQGEEQRGFLDNLGSFVVFSSVPSIIFLLPYSLSYLNAMLSNNNAILVPSICPLSTPRSYSVPNHIQRHCCDATDLPEPAW